MQVIEPSVELLPHPATPLDTMRHIEQCGRVCYKSEGKITPDSYKRFIARIISSGHEAVLEHGNINLRCDFDMMHWFTHMCKWIEKHFLYKPFLRFSDRLVSGNVRAWRDFFLDASQMSASGVAHFVPLMRKYEVLFDDLLRSRKWTGIRLTTDIGDWTEVPVESLCDYEWEVKTHQCETVRFVVDRGVSHELVRHRLASYCQESTRYCNYAKDAFGKEITVISPCFFTGDSYARWFDAMRAAESTYFSLLDAGATAQEARTVLPTSLKTEVIMTATLSEWEHFLKLRTSPAAHPQMREVATQVARLLTSVNTELFKAYV